MDLELRKLIDERAITNQLSKLARILDNRDWNKLSDIYAEDLIFSYPGENPRHGVSEMRKNLEEFLGNCGPTQHLLAGDIITDINGNSAKSSVYAQAMHQGKDERSHLYYNAYGEYLDEWEKRDNGWVIVKREFVIFLVQGDIEAMGTSRVVNTK